MKKRILAVKCIISLFLLVFFFRWVGFERIVDTLKGAEPVNLALGCLTLLLIPVTKSFRFLYLASLLKLRINPTQCFLTHMIVPIIGMMTPGKLGEGLKIFMLKSSKKTLGFSFLTERILDITALIIAAGLGITTIHYSLTVYLAIIIAVIIAVICFIKLDKLLNVLTRMVLKKEYFPQDWFLEQSKLLLTPGGFILVLLTIVVWLLTFGVGYFFIQSMGLTLSYTQAVQTFSWSILIGIVSGLPGGHGIREMSIAYLLKELYGISEVLGGSVAVLNLISHFVVLGLTGLLGYLAYSILNKQE
ncbi:lysylphosphatidylglycerol synthase transmembrane domain-containing protein [Thermodesulfobacteriota bacterium]